jgi:aminoglycoside phosphotransferase family enzyme/predicted kinase
MSHFERIETHISLVLLGRRDVYKLKKPVSLGFLDYSTPELRRAACEAEVRLNQRLAPGIYLGVVPIRRSRKEAPIDWAVHMRRLPDALRADQLLERGILNRHLIDRLALALARFHSQCRCDEETTRYGDNRQIETNLSENFEQAKGAFPERLRELQLGFLKNNPKLFLDRISAQKIRDGHGDLRLDQIYFNRKGEPVILDCIEFNDRFRYADVAADLAFLSMDLRLHGRADLAERLLSTYARESNDFDLFSVVDFYESYRAFVRGKVALLQNQSTPKVSQYFELALSCLKSTRSRPALYAVGGVIATGKSTVAEWLGGRLAAPVVGSDRTRKFLAGALPTERLTSDRFPQTYGSRFSRRVYRELLRRASAVLKSGRTVILDASFSREKTRAGARDLARALDVPFYLIECRASRETCRDRLKKRERGASISDARIALYDRFAASFEPIRELSANEHVVIDTSDGAEFANRLEQLFEIQRLTENPARVSNVGNFI